MNGDKDSLDDLREQATRAGIQNVEDLSHEQLNIALQHRRHGLDPAQARQRADEGRAG